MNKNMKKFWLLVIILILIPKVYLYPSLSTMAITNFQNLTGDSQYDWLGVSFTESLYTYLGKIETLYLIERAQLSQIFSEMKIQLSGAMDEKTFIESGKLYGAKYIVVGSVSKAGQDFLINFRLLEVKTGTVLTTGGEEGGIDEIFNMQRNVAKCIARFFKKGFDKTQAGKSIPAEEQSSKELLRDYLESGNSKTGQRFQKVIDENSGYAELLMSLADGYVNMKDYDAAVEKYNCVLDLYKKQNDSVGISKTYYKLGEVYMIKSDYSVALKLYELSLKNGKTYKDIIYSRITTIGKYNKKMEEAIKYQKKAVEIFETHGYYYSYAQGVSELANMYADIGKYSEAIDTLGYAEKFLLVKNHRESNMISRLKEEIKNESEKSDKVLVYNLKP